MIRLRPFSAVPTRTWSRRSFLAGVSGWAVLAGTGCGGSEEVADLPPATSLPTVVLPATQAPIASPVPGYLDPSRWSGRTVTVASVGGEYQKAQATAMFEPFALATGARVQEKAFTLGEMRQQVEQEAVVWDVVVLPTEEILPLARENYLMAIDYQKVDRGPLFAEIVMQHGVGVAFFSTVLTVPVGVTPQPGSWGDFWDTERFPGPRTLRHDPVGTLEFALIADGVPASRLYPLDVDRAFASLDRIRPHVVQWYDNRNQPVALLLNGDVAMASNFSPVAESPTAQPGLVLVWNGGMLSADSWAIPRGAPNVDVGMDLIAFATRAVPCANFAQLVPFGPVNRDALSMLTPARLATLPNSIANRRHQFYQGWSWWSDRRDDLRARFDEWLLAEPPPTQTEASARPR